MNTRVKHMTGQEMKVAIAMVSNGGRIDATRHIYWNVLMTRGVSEEWAEVFSCAHEQDNPPKSNSVSWNLRNIDLYNSTYALSIWLWIIYY